MAIRFPHLAWDEVRLQNECRRLVGRCRYQLSATDASAPFVANCVTSVRYVLNRVSDFRLPPQWIGNLPRVLSKHHQAVFINTATEQLCCGDLLFVKIKRESRMITHVGLMLNHKDVYHCCLHKGSTIEKIEDFFKKYTQELNQQKILEYIDPRTQPGTAQLS